MQLGRQVRVRAGSGCGASDPAANALLYTATLAQNAGLNGRVQLPEAIAAGRTGACRVRGLQVVSLDNNAWEFWVWANSKFQIANGIGESFRGIWAFAAADGKQIAGTGLYHYYIDGLDFYYEDDDAQTTTPPPPAQLDQTWRAASNGQAGAFLNVTLVNRSAGAKTANGYFDVTFMCEPVLGW